MGIEQLDFLYQQAQIMLGLLSSLDTGLTAINTESEAVTGKLEIISGNLTEIDTNLNSISAAITTQDYETASSIISASKTLVGSAKAEAGYASSIISASKTLVGSAKAEAGYASSIISASKTLVGSAKEEAGYASSIISASKTLVGSAKAEAGYVQSIQATVTSSREALTNATALINSLMLLITEEIQKIAGDGNTWYIYSCSGCSLNCKKEMKFIPPDKKALTVCELDGKKVANFVQVSIGGES